MKSLYNLLLAVFFFSIIDANAELKNFTYFSKKLPGTHVFSPWAIANNVIEIKEGEVLTMQNLTLKRPGTGISPMKIDKILKMKSEYNFKKDDIIKVNKKI